MLITPAWAQAAGGDAGGALGALLPFILIFAVIYLLMIRPQQKRQKEHQAKITAVKRGDEILTAGGLYGKVIKSEDNKNEIEIEIAENITVKVNKLMLADVIPKESKSAKKDKAKEAETAQQDNNAVGGIMAKLFGKK